MIVAGEVMTDYLIDYVVPAIMSVVYLLMFYRWSKRLADRCEPVQQGAAAQERRDLRTATSWSGGACQGS